MLCVKCDSILAGSSLGADPRIRWTDLSGPLSALLCARCGAVLPALDPAHAMLAKLSQLSRFGLGADDRPILALTGGRKA